MSSHQQVSSYNYSSLIRSESPLDISLLINKYFTSHQDLFDFHPQPRQHTASLNHIIKDQPESHSRHSIFDSPSHRNIPNIPARQELSSSSMDDYSQQREQTPQREIPLSPQQQQIEHIQMTELTKMLKKYLSSLNRAISRKELREYCLKKVKNDEKAIANARRRFQNSIARMIDANCITKERKMIVVTQPSDKANLIQKYKEQILEKEQCIELKKQRLNQLKWYKQVIGSVINRNKEKSAISSKKIPYDLTLILHSFQPQTIKFLKPTRQARYTLKIPNSLQNIQHYRYYQILYLLMKDSLPIKTLQE